MKPGRDTDQSPVPTSPPFKLLTISVSCALRLIAISESQKFSDIVNLSRLRVDEFSPDSIGITAAFVPDRMRLSNNLAVSQKVGL